MSVHDLVTAHYGGADLAGRILDALADTGVDVEHLSVPDLSPVDQLHAGFAPATKYVLDRLALRPDTQLLDVGCGIGGPARLAASTSSCRVSGVDLTPEFVQAARTLTARVGLTDRVSFDVAAGDALPFDDGRFEAVTMIHVGMNIADKQSVFAEIRRMLVPGGRLAVYDQMRAGAGELPYPLPWAEDERSSFVESQTQYVEHLRAAGFTVDEVEDRTQAVAGPPPDGPGALSPQVVFGAEFVRRIGNNVQATKDGLLGAVLLVATA